MEKFFRQSVLVAFLAITVLFFANGIAFADASADIQTYTAQINQNPNDAEAYYKRGYVYADLGQTERAMQEYNKAIELNPNYELPYFNIGVVYDDLGQKDLAIQYYDKTIEINPNFAEAYTNRGWVYQGFNLLEREFPRLYRRRDESRFC